MSEATLETAAPIATQAPTAAEVWERVHAPAPEPITKEEVKGVKPGEEPKERKLVAPAVQEFVAKTKEPEPNPFEERLARIEAALTKPKKVEEPALEDEVRALKQMLLEKEQQEAEARAQQEQEETISTFRGGVVSNINDQPERFPLLIALEQQGNVFNELYARLQNGESVSEDDIASEAEAKLSAAFERMVTAKKPTSQEKPASEPKHQPTLTPSLTAADEPADISTILESTGGDVKLAAAQLWDAIHSR